MSGERVAEALARYFEAHRLDRGGYASRTFAVPLGPVRLVFPNPGRLAEHDLHHVALDVPATFWGEVELSAFELRTGAPSAIIALLCVGALALGSVLSPRRVLSAWKRHPRGRSLYRDAPAYEALTAMRVDELRAWMRLDAIG